MAKSVALEFHWPPHVLGGLFIDDWDYKGLTYWYNTCKDIKPKKKQDLSKAFK